MPNHLLIYMIVVLSAASQAMLIWRLRLKGTVKWRYCGLTVLVPFFVAMTMRLLVAAGIVHARVAEQVGIERLATTLASILLFAGPLLVTAFAVVRSQTKLYEKQDV